MCWNKGCVIRVGCRVAVASHVGCNVAVHTVDDYHIVCLSPSAVRQMQAMHTIAEPILGIGFPAGWSIIL